MRILFPSLIGLAVIAMAGCVSPRVPKLVALPSGQSGYAVNCSGTHHNWSDCMNAAGAVCNGAYEVISQNGESVGGVAVAPAANSTVLVRAIHREMIVSCKGAR